MVLKSVQLRKYRDRFVKLKKYRKSNYNWEMAGKTVKFVRVARRTIKVKKVSSKLKFEIFFGKTL